MKFTELLCKLGMHCYHDDGQTVVKRKEFLCNRDREDIHCYVKCCRCGRRVCYYII